MAKPCDPLDFDAVCGALDWWREAGVDCAFTDEPRRWLVPADPTLPGDSGGARPAEEGAPLPAAPDRVLHLETAPLTVAAPADADRSGWPGEVTAFARWWQETGWLDSGRRTGRVSPRGQAGARLMVIVPEPEREDSERLLSGPDGRLLDAMVHAMGLAPDQVYVASALARHTPGADWGQIAAQGLGAVLSHHIALVRPERLVVFGSNILPLIGNAPPHGAADLRIFNHEGASLPMIAAPQLATFANRPRWKARLWRTWLDWTA